MTDSITQPKKDRFDKKMCCRVSFPNRLAKNHGFGLGRHVTTVYDLNYMIDIIRASARRGAIAKF
jgi:hypothetical protein